MRQCTIIAVSPLSPLDNLAVLVCGGKSVTGSEQLSVQERLSRFYTSIISVTFIIYCDSVI